jgi:flagella basal body P-ring formation protein FlgA
VGQKHLIIIFGSIFSFLLIISIGYYIGYVYTWEQFRHQPKIGAEARKMKLVFVAKEIAPGQEIDFNSVEERHDVRPSIAIDAYSFASEVLGRKAKWTLHKGDYISRHDLQPVSKGKSNG